MAPNVHDRLLRRELGGSPAYSSVRAIHGDRKWVRDLDIVNELEGHSGCVNALSWSKSGKLLASGSDDQHLNIHEYISDSSPDSFKLATSVATGHTANIFSVKFMPHSNDRTLVTAAGDCEIRVFDIEYAGRPSAPVTVDVRGSDRAQGLLHRGVQYLSEADTNARVYRSHSDRVKRIVTESSPHLFLSCSEDGEVRQWDLRQPSSAYPRARGGRGWRSATQDEDTGVPPPLISYKRHQLDLNTISCSPSQPHYIALGGAHLHAFLHDRRMLGRDRYRERGMSMPMNGSSEHEDELMGEATQCVRRFAPDGQSRMRTQSNGHITACKISDANPNEMIASWSGDWIYSFDLVRSPDARERGEGKVRTSTRSTKGKAKESSHRKRKRKQEGSEVSQEGGVRARSQPRRSSTTEVEHNEDDEVSIRVRYENGQSESIPLRRADGEHGSLAEAAETEMSEDQRRSCRIANISVKIQKHMFDLGDPKRATEEDPTGHATSFTSVLGFSSSILEDMDDIIRAWRYPVDPDQIDITYQRTLRRQRESARRFIQASGTIARLLGGKLRTASGQHPMLRNFAQIVPAPNEMANFSRSEQFCYDFIKAIALWLDSGPGALAENFSRKGSSPRFPLPEDASIDAIDDVLIPYLLRLAGDRPVPDADASPFEVDENRQVFASERAAVLAFANALKIPFEDLSPAVVPASSEESSSVERPAVQHRRTALRFWGLRVTRGLLLSAGDDVNYANVDRGFGGLGRVPAEMRNEERRLRRRYADIDPETDDPAVESVGLRDQGPSRASRHTRVEDASVDEEDGDGDGDVEMLSVDDVGGALLDAEDNTGEEDDSDGDVDDDSERASESEDEGEDSDEPTNVLFSRALRHSRRRASVNPQVPCIPHHRHYRGHCNVKTVKDVNFYGPNDEYVVSGSDCGNLFIWDKHTSELVNILEGDGEVVNVVQGHPYEPMLAVSGIDSTIKIFGADARARRDARRGIGVTASDDSNFSSLRYGMRRRPARRRMRPSATAEDDEAKEADEDTAMAQQTTSEPAVPRRQTLDYDSDDSDNPQRPATPPNGMSSKRRMRDEYRITSENDVNRRGGNREAFITRSMLAQLAQRLRLRVARGGALGDGEDEEGEAVVIGPGGLQVVAGDDCSVM